MFSAKCTFMPYANREFVTAYETEDLNQNSAVSFDFVDVKESRLREWTGRSGSSLPTYGVRNPFARIRIRYTKKGKRKVQRVPQSQTAALPRPQEEEETEPFPDPKRKRKPTNSNKHKPNKRTKSTKISSLFPKRGNRNTKRTEKHKNKMTHRKTYNKSPRRINLQSNKE